MRFSGRLCVSVALWLVFGGVIAGAQSATWPSERPPGPLAAREVRFPPYEVRTLRNGLQVITVLHHEQPAVSMRLLVRAGSVQDPAKKSGVAGLVASLLDQGTATKSAEQIADEIDFIGGALGTGSGSDLTFINSVVMKDSFNVGMNLLADVVRNPAFAPAEIERQKEQKISSLQVSSNDPDYVASVLLDRLVYGFHPYGLPNSGTPETLAAITRADLQEFHSRYFVPNNMILAIVGDVMSDEAFAAAERVFGGWPRGEVPAVTVVDPPQPTRRVVIVDKPDSVQTEIRVGQLAIPRKHLDYMAWDLAVKILGGEGANRLHRVLRSERGLTYGAQAETEARKQAGHVVAETDTRTETTGEALRLIVDEFSRLQRERVFERELSDAQAYLAGSFPLTIETPNDIATQVLNVVFYELPVEEIGTFRERVQAVRPDDIQRVARQYIRPDRLSIVLVGDASTFIPQLQRVGFTDFDVIPIEELDLMSATLRVEKPRAQAADSPVRGPGPAASANGVRGPGAAASPDHRAADPARAAYAGTQVNPAAGDAADILQSAIEAKGGLDRLRALQAIVADAVMELQTPQGAVSAATKTYISYPDRFRLDTLVPGQESTLVYNRGQVWMKNPLGVEDAPEVARKDASASVNRDVVLLLLAALDRRLPVRRIPENETGRTPAHRALELETPDSGPVRLYFDSRMQVIRQSYGARGMEGEPMRGEEIFSDYRPVEGLMLAFEAQIMRAGRVIVKRTLKNVSVNDSLADALFIRPQ